MVKTELIVIALLRRDVHKFGFKIWQLVIVSRKIQDHAVAILVWNGKGLSGTEARMQ
jgi:hypothetical protein